MCLDFEDLARNAMSGPHALEFLDRSNQKLGRATTLYGGNRIVEHVNAQDPKWIDMAKVTPLWLCQYKSFRTVADLAELNRYIHIPPPWTHYDLLQYAADGAGPQPHQVAGLEDGADLNAYDGTADQLAASWAGNSLVSPIVRPPLPPVPPPLDIKWLQTTLNAKIGAGLTVDGIYGHKTILAVRRFQALNNLSVDGMAGPITINVMRQ
jgi:hypothetical protein